MEVLNRVRSLCTPAFVFFVISILSIFFMIFHNVENTHEYCFWNVSCNVANTSMIFIVKIIAIVVWTWLLEVLCSRGYQNVAWFILMFPYIIFFILLIVVANEIRNTKQISVHSIAKIDTFTPTPSFKYL